MPSSYTTTQYDSPHATTYVTQYNQGGWCCSPRKTKVRTVTYEKHPGCCGGVRYGRPHVSEETIRTPGYVGGYAYQPADPIAYGPHSGCHYGYGAPPPVVVTHHHRGRRHSSGSAGAAVGGAVVGAIAGAAIVGGVVAASRSRS